MLIFNAFYNCLTAFNVSNTCFLIIQYSSSFWYGSFNIYLFLGFGQFWRASLQHNDTRVPKLEAYVSFHINDKIEITQIMKDFMNWDLI